MTDDLIINNSHERDVWFGGRAESIDQLCFIRSSEGMFVYPVHFLNVIRGLGTNGNA